MRHRSILLAAVTAATLALAAAAPARAGSLGELKLADKPVELLGGRLAVQLPAEAQVEPDGERAIDVPRSDRRNTRVLLRAGNEEMGLFADELFQTADGQFEATVRKELASVKDADYQVEPLKLADAAGAAGLAALRVWPGKVKVERDQYGMARGAFVVMPDKTVIFVVALVNSQAARDMDGCRKLADRILSSLRPGPNLQLHTAAGEGRIRLYSKDYELTVQAPAGFVLTGVRGRDFLAYDIQKIVPFGSQAPIASLYYGRFPRYQYKQLWPRDIQAAESAGELLDGRKLTWYAWSPAPTTQPDAGDDGPAAGRMNLEGRIFRPLPDEKASRYLHLYLSAPDAAQLAAVKAVVGTMKVLKSPNPSAEPPAAAPTGRPAPATPSLPQLPGDDDDAADGGCCPM